MTSQIALCVTPPGMSGSGFLTTITRSWEICDHPNHPFICLPHPSSLVAHRHHHQQHCASTDIRGTTVLDLCFDLSGAIKEMIVHLQT